jgi:hypothetical protein
LETFLAVPDKKSQSSSEPAKSAGTAKSGIREFLPVKSRKQQQSGVRIPFGRQNTNALDSALKTVRLLVFRWFAYFGMCSAIPGLSRRRTRHSDSGRTHFAHIFLHVSGSYVRIRTLLRGPVYTPAHGLRRAMRRHDFPLANWNDLTRWLPLRALLSRLIAREPAPCKFSHLPLAM